MRAAPLKGDCVICQAPEPIRVAVNAAIWPHGEAVRAADYRAAGVRAAGQLAQTIPDAERYHDLDPKTITRHADHVEGSWREVTPGRPLGYDEVPVATDFASVVEAGTRLGMKAMAGLESLIDVDPIAFAALRTKEAIAVAKLGVGSSGMRETSRLKRNQQAIDVMAIFASSSGHVRPPSAAGEDDEELDDMRAEIAAERALLTARASE